MDSRVLTREINKAEEEVKSLTENGKKLIDVYKFNIDQESKIKENLDKTSKEIQDNSLKLVEAQITLRTLKKLENEN